MKHEQAEIEIQKQATDTNFTKGRGKDFDAN